MNNKILEISQLPIECLLSISEIKADYADSFLFKDILLEIYNGFPGSVGSERILNVVNFISDRIPEYAILLNTSLSEALDIVAKARRVNYANWFQDGNIPTLKDVSIFETKAHFQSTFSSGNSICPACSGISTNYRVCNSGVIIKKKICDWKAFGLFGTLNKGVKILIKENAVNFPSPVSIFKPIEYDKYILNTNCVSLS